MNGGPVQPHSQRGTYDHVTTVHLRSHVAPCVGEAAVCLAADVLVDAADPVEEHLTRIFRSAERKMNAARSNG